MSGNLPCMALCLRWLRALASFVSTPAFIGGSGSSDYELTIGVPPVSVSGSVRPVAWSQLISVPMPLSPLGLTWVKEVAGLLAWTKKLQNLEVLAFEVPCMDVQQTGSQKRVMMTGMVGPGVAACCSATTDKYVIQIDHYSACRSLANRSTISCK